MKPVIFDPEAQDEVDHALAASLVPDEFRDAIEAIVAVLVANPGYGFATTTPGVRRAVQTRFPYSVIYADERTRLFVLAFPHHSRRPGYWNKRLRPN
ncbi:MAG: type II toxin-antitoxin system RelE/ParE family toxin [Gemmataceae bacterium]